MKYNESNWIYPKYSFKLFPFERDFDSRPWMVHLGSNFNIFYYLCLGYIVILFSGKQFMRHREPFKLKPLLFIWNSLLAIFSLCGFIRMVPEFLLLIDTYGLDGITCVPLLEKDPSAIFHVAFGLSKIVEFGDTFLLVVRKKPVIFLHWFHHITALLLAIHSITSFNPMGRFLAIMNYGIHSIMYTYYGISSMGIRLPKIIAPCITSAQLLQMVTGVFVAHYSVKHCDRSDNSSAYYAILLYATYGILFANFFIQSYCKKKQTTDSIKRD